jgi:hypothetical protein
MVFAYKLILLEPVAQLVEQKTFNPVPIFFEQQYYLVLNVQCTNLSANRQVGHLIASIGYPIQQKIMYGIGTKTLSVRVNS